MKIHSGFISNSSSQSFVIPKTMLTEKQIYKIKNYRHFGKKLGMQYAECPFSDMDAWTFIETDDHLEGKTPMNNFNMIEFMEKIGAEIPIHLFS
jgi:hypothetical protein